MNLGSGFADAMKQMQKGNMNAIGDVLDRIETTINDGNQTQSFTEEDKQSRERIASGLAKFAATKPGNDFFEWLVDISFGRVVYPVGITGVPREERADYAAMREGQNALVTDILRLIAEGRGDVETPQRKMKL